MFPLIYRIIIYIGLVVLLSSCIDPYSNHYKASQEHLFSASGSMPAHSGSVDGLFILPDRQVQSTIIQSFDQAKERIYLQIYILTDKEILESLIRAHDRGVDVRVVIEGNPYKTPSVNNFALKELKNKNIPFVYSDPDRFAMNHAKFWIVDDSYFMSTGNLTRTFFESNRDILIQGRQSPLLDALITLFLSDFHRESFYIPSIPSGLIISPENSFSGIIHAMEKSQTGIIVYIQSLTDSRIIEKLGHIQARGVNVRLCLGNAGDEISMYEKYDLTYYKIKKPYIHAKVILIDDRFLFIGSQNLTENSLMNNREVGLIFEPKKEQLKRIKVTLERDCKIIK